MTEGKAPTINYELLGESVAHLTRQINRIANEMAVFTKQACSMGRELVKKVDDYEKNLKKITKVNECVDETLCKVLLAIKQNEYLQAWYPDGRKST